MTTENHTARCDSLLRQCYRLHLSLSCSLPHHPYAFSRRVPDYAYPSKIFRIYDRSKTRLERREKAFIQALHDNLGKIINVCAISDTLQSGDYLLDAVIFHNTGGIELGLSDTLTSEHIGCFSLFRDVEIGG